ncbi:MAG: hypothetical protein WD294_14950 [Phycisphaeraceae bacterium]
MTKAAAIRATVTNHPELQAAYVLEHNMPRLKAQDAEHAQRNRRIAAAK